MRGSILSTALLSLLPASVMASCGYGLDFVAPRTINVTVPNFDYGTTTGPENWHHIQASYGTCANGTHQSPILISSTNTTIAPAGSINLHIPPQYDAEFENLGTNVEVVCNGTLEAANTTWKLAQFHFHAPSEHRVDYGHYEAEMHFVFAAADGSSRAAVLGFFVEVEKYNGTWLLESLFSHLPEIQNPGTATTIPELDFGSFEAAANAQDYYTYSGSLTTPPCTEGVLWYIGTKPLTITIETYIALKNTVKTNNRFTQSYRGDAAVEDILQIAAQGI